MAALTQLTSAYTWSGHPTSPNAVNETHDGLNRISTMAALTNGYDPKGNLTNDGRRTLVYEAENRLVDVYGTAPEMLLAYDPLGRIRATVVLNSTTQTTGTYFLHDGDSVVAEYTANFWSPGSQLLRRYVPGPGVDEPLIWYEGTGTADRRFFHANRQGSITAVTDSAGRLKLLPGGGRMLYAYGPYGEASDWQGSRFRYTGQMMLPEPQVYHYKARAYEPALGRFLQTDPIGQADDANLYAYVKDDPTDRADPTGLEGANVALGQMPGDSAKAPGPTLGQVANFIDAVSFAGIAVETLLTGGASALGPDEAELGAERAATAELRAGSSEVHGNSLSSTRPQHTYTIKDASGRELKHGISGQKLNANGTSRRANSQIKGLEGKYGPGVKADVTKTDIGGRAEALKAEKAAVDASRAKGSDLPEQLRPR